MKELKKLMLNKISKEEFLAINNILEIKIEVGSGLKNAYKNHDAERVDELMYLIFMYEAFELEYVDILNKLLVSEWHFQHENIVLALQKISSIDSLDYLYKAIELNLEYLLWDENHAFEIKCVRGIYYIGKEKGIPYLEKLCNHKCTAIKEMAQRQLKKLL